MTFEERVVLRTYKGQTGNGLIRLYFHCNSLYQHVSFHFISLHNLPISVFQKRLNGRECKLYMLTVTVTEFVCLPATYIVCIFFSCCVSQVQANLGYCPQLDALIDQMTGRETLNMYARLRGIPPKHLPRVVTSLLSILMLDEPADRLTRFYR